MKESVIMEFYTLQDLLSGSPVYINKLKTDSLQELYELFCSNAYVYELSNGKFIKLLFTEYQFCHLIGFSYFGFHGIDGWNDLKANPKEVVSFSSHLKFKMLQYRIANFNRIHSLLNSPDIYIYEASLYDNLKYQSVYFAVFKHNGRIYKLGIGLSDNGYNYPETFLNDKDMPEYNYYLLPENLLSIVSQSIIPKIDYLKTVNITN